MLIKLDDISKRVAKRLNINENQLREINRSQWKLLLDKMQEGNLEGVKIIYLGKFSKKIKREYKPKGNI